ncbi:tetratricopeptide repeat protein [bacterium]|nr:tetratricopeptide repeat protein [bacterium]
MLKPRRKLSRRQIKQDKLVTYYLQATDFINRNSKLVLTGVIGFVVVVVLVTMILRSKHQANLAASGILAEAMLYYQMEDYDKAIPILEKVVKNYSGTRNAGLATFYLANCYYYKNNYRNAKKYYQKYFDDYHSMPLLSSSALAGIAACLETQGKFLEAAQYYHKSATKFSKLYNAPEYLFLAALCYSKVGKTNQAKTLLKKLIDNYPDAPNKTDAQLLLAYL